MVGTLASADIREVPGAIQKLSGDRRWADPLLLKIVTANPEPNRTPEATELRNKRSFARVALLPVDPSQLGCLRDRLLNDRDINAFPTLCQLLSSHRDKLVDPLWKVLEDNSSPSMVRFRAALALAGFTGPDETATASRWAKSGQFVANEMVKAIVADPNHYTAIVDTLKPVRRHLVKPLSEAFQDPNQLRHVLYSAILAEYATDQPEVLAEMVVGAGEPDAFGKVVDSLFKAKGQGADLLEMLLDTRSPGITIETTRRGRRMLPWPCMNSEERSGSGPS